MCTYVGTRHRGHVCTYVGTYKSELTFDMRIRTRYSILICELVVPIGWIGYLLRPYTICTYLAERLFDLRCCVRASRYQSTRSVVDVIKLYLEEFWNSP